MIPMTISEIEKAVGGTLLSNCPADIAVKSVSVDSRSLQPGALFVPIAGPAFDGHDFIGEAFSKGAVCALSEKNLNSEKISSAGPVIGVSDTRKALGALAAYYRKKFGITVIAVTGSNGKTTAKDLMAAVLSKKYNVLKTRGNLNNDIGLPLSLFELDTLHQIAVLEMGMNAKGEIAYLSGLAKPCAAVITNIGTAHMERLGSREGILSAKSEVFGGMDGGRAFLNGDDALLRTLSPKGIDITYYGLSPHNNVYATAITGRGIRGMGFTVNAPGLPPFEILTRLPGKHNVYNALAAIAAGLEYGVSPDSIREALADFTASGQRMDITENAGGVVIINDTYNASPDSVKAALDVLSLAEGRKIAVLGDMLELGDIAGESHTESGRYAAGLDIDIIMCVGAESRQTYSGAFGAISRAESLSRAVYCKDKHEALGRLQGIIQAGDTVLIKASRAMKFEEIVKALTGDERGGTGV